MMVNYDAVVGKRKHSKKHKNGNLYYVSNRHLTPEFLMDFARKYHHHGEEGQTLLIMDEAQMIVGPTQMKLMSQKDSFYRIKWLDFFTQHRHMGYNIIIVSQFDRLIDPQVRCLFEYNVVHRKANNVGTFGMLLSAFKLKLFVRIEKWYGTNQTLSADWFLFNKNYAKIYDSWARFKLAS